jgi:hypothetical protein
VDVIKHPVYVANLYTPRKPIFFASFLTMFLHGHEHVVEIPPYTVNIIDIALNVRQSRGITVHRHPGQFAALHGPLHALHIWGENHTRATVHAAMNKRCNQRFATLN